MGSITTHQRPPDINYVINAHVFAGSSTSDNANQGCPGTKATLGLVLVWESGTEATLGLVLVWESGTEATLRILPLQ